MKGSSKKNNKKQTSIMIKMGSMISILSKDELEFIMMFVRTSIKRRMKKFFNPEA